MDIVELITTQLDRFKLGTLLALWGYLSYKEVWVWGSTSRREVLLAQRQTELVQEQLGEQIKSLVEQLKRCHAELERWQMMTGRGNIMIEKTVQIAEEIKQLAPAPEKPKKESET